MSWRDRRYYGSDGGDDYLSSPASVLTMSVPFGTWFGARVRLHFWMLLSLLFAAVYQARGGSAAMIPVLWAMILAGVMIHEFGRRIFTRFVGGAHNEFMLWPAGGVIHPSYPDRAGAMFISHIGGVVANLVVGSICGAVLAQGGYPAPWRVLLNPLMAFLGFGGAALDPNWPSMVWCFLLANAGVMWASLLPYYWFDGGYLLQSVLWPLTGRRHAIIVTCIIGMALAIFMFFLSLGGADLMGMILWALLFASALTRWKQARYESDLESSAGEPWRSSLEEQTPRHRRPGRLTRWMIQRKAAQEQQEQAAVDRILEKVAQHGMHSLTNSEKRTLQRASERLREERRT